MNPSRAPLSAPAPDRGRRVRLIATGLLIAMAAILLAARQLSFAYPHAGWGFLIAFTEAAMVGGLADWFAVTALFRRPLGLPIPHTAIIPENKDRIADTMAVFLRQNFLTPAVVARRLHGFNVADMVGSYLTASPRSRPGGFVGGATGLLADMLESLDPERLGGQVRAGLARQLDRLEVAPPLGRILQAMIADGRHIAVMDALIGWAGKTLEANEELVRATIHQRAHALLRWTGLDERLANAVLDGLYKLLAEVLVTPDHPLRAKVQEGLEKLAHDLVHDPATRAKVEAAKQELLANPAVAAWWQGVWERIRRGLITALRNPDAASSGQLGEALAEVGNALQDDPRLQVQVNRFARRTLVGVASRYGDEIVRIVSETVKRWDARTVTGRIEGAVGRDLQFIRINGTLVGGLVGLLLHALDVAL